MKIELKSIEFKPELSFGSAHFEAILVVNGIEMAKVKNDGSECVEIIAYDEHIDNLIDVEQMLASEDCILEDYIYELLMREFEKEVDK